MAGPLPGAGANPGPWIADKIRQGVTKTAALREWRSAGYGIRTQRWYQLWNTVSESIRTRIDVTQLPGHRIPTPDQFTPWATARPGKFAYNVNVQIFDVDSGSYVTSPSMVLYDRRVSINKAIADVMERVEEAYDEQGEYAGFRVHSATIAGIYETVPIDNSGV